ncbi:hypothetical protein JCM21900_002842 [Sporobolomyces salmonicolor]
MEDDRPTAARIDVDEAEEDALPDWRQFGKFLKTNGDKAERAVLVPFIPKRGEKDFEPLAASSSFPPSSKEATLSQHQLNTLHESRTALYQALSSGSRHHSSRAHNSFTWRPELDGGRATCDAGIATYGVHFGNLGHFNPERKQVELLPEEALYMVERGAIELWKEGEPGARVPMSVQQAWGELMGHSELTPERYQVYAFLKRLGYVLVRARPIPGVERPEPTRPFSLYHASRQALILPFTSTRDLVLHLVHSLRTWFTTSFASRVRLIVTRAVGGREGCFASLVSGRRWATYDQIFSRLQIIPSGHDAPLPRASLPHTPSELTPLVPLPPHCKPDLPDLAEHPYQPFFHMYKPVTKYKKSNPPPPDFRIVVINGATTPMPDLFEFTDMFNSVPFPSEDTLLPPPPVVRALGPPQAGSTPRPRPPRRHGGPAPAPAAPAPPPTPFQRLLARIPVLSRYGACPAAPARPPKKKPSPYPRLKTGRRSILVAVVDNGTTSILRFSETEFAKLPWVGAARKT